MKKFFTLTLALLASFSLWAADVITLKGATTKDSKTTALTPTISSTNANITLGTCASTCSAEGYVISTADGKSVKLGGTITYYVGQPYQSGSKKYWKDAGANFYGTFTIPSGYTYTIKGVNHALAAVSSSNFTATITVKDATTTKYTSGSLSVASKSSGATITSTAINLAEANWVVLSAGTYTINVTPTNTADASTGKYFGIAEVALTGDLVSTTPTLTGAWILSEEDVTGTSIEVVQSSSPAPTLPTFTVGATSGSNPAGYYNVAYALKEGSTSGIFTFTDGVPTAISTATAGSATIVATLTTADASKYLTPETNTFEYTVSVSEASAPTVTVTGAGSIARGGELTLTAEKTGVPTPTLNWYACNSEGTLSGESLGTADTYAPSTTTVGTYYFRAVVNNGVGGDASHNVLSAVQTITVNPKAPTLPASAIFVDNTSVTISKAEGEAEAAVIKYSTDGETYYTYSEAIVLSATTTIYAKVEQAGLSSAVASATYTLIVLDEQVDVKGSVTWDWSEVTNSSAVDLGSTELNNQDVLYSNISKYGYTAVSGLASQQALLMNGQRAYNNANGSKHCQVNYLKFNTTVAGSVTIEYANTGGNAARTVNVNGTKGSKSVTTNTDYVDEVFNVAVGTVTIKGVQVSDDADKMLRIRKVVFTKSGTVGVNNVESSAKAVKVLKNGVLLIEKNGKVYNAQGNVVK